MAPSTVIHAAEVAPETPSAVEAPAKKPRKATKKSDAKPDTKAGTPKKWDPDALVAFYQKIGARYVVPVATHHDNFDCYDSSYQSWNAVRMGPKRDLAAEWNQTHREPAFA